MTQYSPRQFIAGCPVRLRSGGPIMTIDRIDYDRNYARCAWFEERKARFASYQLEALMRVGGEAPAV